MLDDLLDIASEILFEMSVRMSTKRSTKRLLGILSLLLGFAGIICYICFD